jgi:hypothetical protein
MAVFEVVLYREKCTERAEVYLVMQFSSFEAEISGIFRRILFNLRFKLRFGEFV